MDKNEYKELVKSVTPKEPKWRNAFVAFLVGGAIGSFSVIVVNIMMMYNMGEKEATTWMLLLLILMACLFTCLGFFDKWVSSIKAGLIVPITGFAHSITSVALDYKNDGYVTGVGSNFFKLAGSVVLYGVTSGFVLAMIKVIFNG